MTGAAVRPGSLNGWIALGSDPAPRLAPETRLRSGALLAVLGGVPQSAAVVLELAEGAIRLAPRQGQLWPEAGLAASSGLSLLCGRDVGLVLRHRRGDQVVHHALPGPIPATAGPLVVRLDWAGAGLDGAGGRWRLDLMDSDGVAVLPGVSGSGALAPDAAAVWALCRVGPHRLAHPALGTVGARQTPGSAMAPETLAWSPAAISAHTPVDTPRGPRPLGTLTAGDAVLDMDGRMVRLAALHLADVPPGFPFSPRRLRAVRLPVTRDLLAGPMTRLVCDGDEAHALSGSRRAMVRAAFLPDPVARPMAGPLRSLLLALPVPDRPAVLAPGGLPVACPDPSGVLPADGPDLARAAALMLLEGADLVPRRMA